MPLLGFLSIMAGGGMLYSAQKFSVLFDDGGVYLRAIGGVIGIVLILSGLRLVATRFGRRPSAHVTALNSNRVMLPREGMMYLLIMIVAFVASLIGRSNMLMLIFSIMAGPFILNGWVTYSLLKRNHVTRRLPRRAMAGEVVSVELTLDNRKFWFSSWLIVVRDRIRRVQTSRGSDREVRTSEVLEPAVLFASVRPRRSRSACYQVRLNQRGRYQFGPLEVSTRFPLGLVERGFVTNVPDELLIHPPIGTLSPRWRREAQLASDVVQNEQSRRGIFDDEFHHLREFRPGDNPRDIHWRTSARLNELTVQEFRQSRDRGLIVLLELWQPDRPSEEDVDRVELAASFVATVCVNHLRETRGVEQVLLTSGVAAQQLTMQSGSAAVDAVLDLLAEVEAGSAPDMLSSLERLRASVGSTNRIVVVTTRPETATADWMSEVVSLPGAELYHATAEGLGRWFSLDSTTEPLFTHQPSDTVSQAGATRSHEGVTGSQEGVARS